MMSIALGRRIRALRRLKLVTQQELAHRINISVTVLSNIERGQRTPPARLLEDIADKLKVSCEELFILNLNDRQEYDRSAGGRTGF